MSKIVLRPATTTDVPAVLAFWKNAAEDAHRPADSVEAVEALVRRDPDALILALDESADGEPELVGTVIAGWDGWRCHIYRVAVAPHRRRLGIGRTLLDAAEQRFARLGGTRADAMVLDENSLAHSVWKASGYAPQPEWSRWVKPLAPLPQGSTSAWETRPARPADVEPIAELRAVTLRPDLERLGRYDEHRVRQRLRDEFEAKHTSVIEVAGAFAGCIALRPADDGHWLEHFYLDPGLQGRGIGSAVLSELLESCDRERIAVRVNVLQGSPARRLYARHGFTVVSEDAVDIFMLRRASVA